MWPARMPPITPPKSNNVDRAPAVESDKYFPPTAGRKKQDGKAVSKQIEQTEISCSKAYDAQQYYWISITTD